MVQLQHGAFVLLSGGLDSTVALYHAVREYKSAVGISVNYGQRHSREIEHAKAICDRAGIPHQVLHMPPGLLDGVMLTDRNQTIPDLHYDQIEGVSPTYVPFRNGLMLSMITAYAHKWCVLNQAEEGAPIREAVVVIGAHAEDAHNWAYPDCTPEFLGAMANAIFIATYRQVRLVAPLMHMRKYEIVELGHKLDAPFELTWSCYAGGDKHCGACPTCYARRGAFNFAGIADPTEYAVNPDSVTADEVSA
jgi:7-cyano-7-deazaguanine synthase